VGRSASSGRSGGPVLGDPAAAVWREPLFWLALTLALGRFLHLGDWSLWEDEVFTLADARAMLEPGSGSGPRNPLGYLVFAGVIQWLGEVPGEAGLRLLPAVFGVLGIAACGLCFAPLFGSRRAAAAAAVVAASTWHLYWSQNARFYTLAQDCSVLGGALALRAVLAPRGERFGPFALGSLACLLLAALAQPSSALLLPAWFLAALALPRKRFAPEPRGFVTTPSVLLLAGLLGLAIAVWLGPAWLDYYRTKHDPTALHLVQSSGWYFTPALLAAAAFGAFGGWRARSAPDVLAALGCGFMAALMVANACFVRAAAQYLFVLLPFVAVLATQPLAADRAPLRWKTAWLAALILPALLDQVLYFTARNGDRPQWREAFAEVYERKAPGDLVFTNNANVGEYYFAPRSDGLRHPVHVHNLDRYSFLAEQHWARQPRRAWFVINEDRLLEWPARAREEFLAMLASNARLVASFELDVGVRDLDVRVYLRE
jgi:mannosyltransferase